MKNVITTILLIFAFTFQNINAAEGEVLYVKIDEGIGSFTATYLETVVEDAEDKNYEAVLVTIDTPGGLLDATRDIVSTFLEAKVPVIVFVAPSGARAGSAGVFITMAGNIAAMAPGTNIGAAHPVGLGGQSGDSSDVMTQKVTNDAAAFIRTIAERRGRNVEFAEETVRESISVTENEALERGGIDVIAKTKKELLEKIHGMEVETAVGKHTLNTENAKIVEREKNWKESLLSFLSDPNIAYIFVLLAMYGILIELYNPGAIFPGTIGVVSAILAGYSLQMLPVNYAGLALMIIAGILFILEIKVTSFGLLSIGGIVSFVLGSILLIDSPGDIMEVSMSVIIPATLLTVAVFLGIVYFAVKSQGNKRVSGIEGLTGEIGVALEDIAPGKPGTVRVHAESWNAISENHISKGDEVKVVSVEGLKMKVEKI